MAVSLKTRCKTGKRTPLLRRCALAVTVAGVICALVGVSGYAWAQTDAQAADGNPSGINLLNVVNSVTQPQQISSTLMVVFIVTIISLAPAILVMTTSFTRIVIVLGFLRQAMATQQTPPSQVIIGLSLILTFFVMAPTYQEVNEKALQPYIRGDFSPDTAQQDAWQAARKPLRDFMFRQTRAKDIALFLHIAKLPRPHTRDDVPTHVLLPSFMMSELRKAFQMGFILYIPFLIIDMVVASTLMSMGMMMLPPIFVSLPFKIILFVLADGWQLVVESLVRSFN